MLVAKTQQRKSRLPVACTVCGEILEVVDESWETYLGTNSTASIPQSCKNPKKKTARNIECALPHVSRPQVFEGYSLGFAGRLRGNLGVSTHNTRGLTGGINHLPVLGFNAEGGPQLVGLVVPTLRDQPGRVVGQDKQARGYSGSDDEREPSGEGTHDICSGVAREVADDEGQAGHELGARGKGAAVLWRGYLADVDGLGADVEALAEALDGAPDGNHGQVHGGRLQARAEQEDAGAGCDGAGAAQHVGGPAAALRRSMRPG
ncbi:hypothetical protein DHEL01_v204548 [Diaporthe helianthi]|uniref:Uncharacterized protein n=1 Tax=Diaporthe helianthi TaxID=158607 RepID=A0A2P5I3J9_DIAHE|nr:hypothetical protein DHEL01_v204548 [Diaporthe helianthi]